MGWDGVALGWGRAALDGLWGSVGLDGLGLAEVKWGWVGWQLTVLGCDRLSSVGLGCDGL